MLIVQVLVHVKSQFIQDFIQATLENASNSLREPGVARFDVLQREDDPARFLLNEVYRTEEAPAAHKLTPHYLKWKETVEEMMAAPRTSVRYSNLFPQDTDW